MNVPLEVDPAELRRRAELHAQAIDAITASRAEGSKMIEDARSLGPLYHEVRDAVGTVVEARDQALAKELHRHEQIKDALLVSAATYEQMEADNLAQLSNISNPRGGGGAQG